MSSVPRLPRRAVLIGALAPLAPLASPPPVPAAVVSAPALIDLQRLVVFAKAAWNACPEDHLPGAAEANERAAALDAEITARAAAIWATPVTGWADVIARAEIADNWAAYDDHGRLWDLSNSEAQLAVG
jgi:hypothetical protein